MAISEAKITRSYHQEDSKFSRLQLHVKLTRENFLEQLLEIAAELEISRVPSSGRTGVAISAGRRPKAKNLTPTDAGNHKSIVIM